MTPLSHLGERVRERRRTGVRDHNVFGELMRWCRDRNPQPGGAGRGIGLHDFLARSSLALSRKNKAMSSRFAPASRPFFTASRRRFFESNGFSSASIEFSFESNGFFFEARQISPESNRFSNVSSPIPPVSCQSGSIATIIMAKHAHFIQMRGCVRITGPSRGSAASTRKKPRGSAAA